MGPDIRDHVGFVNHWSVRAEINAGKLVRWMGIGRSKCFSWRERYGKVNEHNAWTQRGFWLDAGEEGSILQYYSEHDTDGSRRLAFMMLDEDLVAVSPSTVYRVLVKAGVMSRWERRASRKGVGFEQPLKTHEAYDELAMKKYHYIFILLILAAILINVFQFKCVDDNVQINWKALYRWQKSRYLEINAARTRYELFMIMSKRFPNSTLVVPENVGTIPQLRSFKSRAFGLGQLNEYRYAPYDPSSNPKVQSLLKYQVVNGVYLAHNYSIYAKNESANQFVFFAYNDDNFALIDANLLNHKDNIVLGLFDVDELVQPCEILFLCKDSYVDLKISPRFTTESSFTFEMWVKITDIIDSSSVLLGPRESHAGAYGFHTHYQGRISFGVRTDSDMVRVDFRDYELNKWYHLAGVYDAEIKTISFYVNGRLINNSRLHGCSTFLSEKHFGINAPATIHGPRSKRGHVNCVVRDIRVWNVARTHDDVVNNMLKIISDKNRNNLVGYWPLDAESGAKAVNLVNGQSGIIHAGKWELGY